MNRVKDQLKLLGEDRFMGRPHTKLGTPFSSSPDLTLFLDNKTKLINRMLRVNPQVGDLDHIFMDHITKNGVTSATKITFSISGDINFASMTHDFEAGIAFTDALVPIPKGFITPVRQTDFHCLSEPLMG
jgi:hypothetical protein